MGAGGEPYSTAPLQPASQARKPVHGSTARVPGQKPVSSIPAKFETVLFIGPRERKGFGSEGKRFEQTESDTPGPGTYKGSPRNETLEFQHDSISKRGYGAMASRDKRFDRKFKYTGPGPGEYRQRAPELLVADKYFNKASSTAVFHTPMAVAGAAAELEHASLPGPGAYSPAETRTGGKIDLLSAPQSHRSAFKAGGHKLQLLGNPESPAPTRYSLPDPWQSGPPGTVSAIAGGSGSKAGTSSFVGRSVASLGAVPPMPFLDDGGGRMVADTGPGPGAYETQVVGSVQQSLAKAAAKPSSTFTAPEFVDRFGKPLAPPAEPPKPVDYSLGGTTRMGSSPERGLPLTGPPKGVSAPFKSQSPGHADHDLRELARAPGPAFYNPKIPEHKSHHLNSRKTFVPMTL